MPPSSVLALCSELYNKEPDAYILSIKGYRWDLAEDMSSMAKDNLDKALVFLKGILTDPSGTKAFD